MKTKLPSTRPLRILAVGLASLLLWPLWANAEGSPEKLEESQPFPVASPPTLTGDEIFSKLVEHSRQRDRNLERYSVTRTYEVSNPEGKVYAQEIVDVNYRAPDQKTFTKKSEQGSWVIRRLVLNRLIESEEQTATGRDHRDSSINPRNYSFKLLGEDQVGPYLCYVVEANPKREDKYLFEGRIWISKQDFGIVKIAGHPARKLSFWIERVDFVRRYQKIGPFWLPQRDETIATVRLKGKKILTIDHVDYAINGADTRQEQRESTGRISPRANPESEDRIGFDETSAREFQTASHSNAPEN